MRFFHKPSLSRDPHRGHETSPFLYYISRGLCPATHRRPCPVCPGLVCLLISFLFDMVTSTNADLYTPFPQGMTLEEGPQSSEEGSGLHSPIFGAPFPPPHGDSSRKSLSTRSLFSHSTFSPASVNKVRYHHDQVDVQHAAGILASQFDYNAAPSLNIQQPPLLDTTLEVPNSGAHHQHVNYPSEFPLPPRNQLGLDFPVQSVANSRLPPPPAHGGPVDYTFQSSSERRLPGGPSHDHPYPRSSGNTSGMPIDGDHRSSSSSVERNDSSASNVPSGSREPRKEISTVVIACRQWYVSSAPLH